MNVRIEFSISNGLKIPIAFRSRDPFIVGLQCGLLDTLNQRVLINSGWQFIDAFTGREELRRSYGAIEDRRRTREVQQADEYEDETGRKIMFVEMPGFFDDPPSDMIILKSIAEYLDAS